LEAEIINASETATYIIERKLNPQSLKIWKDGTNITRSTTAETNKHISDIFYADKDIFQNCIVMRANNTVPFMARKKQDKKNFIETIFNLNIFSIMSRLLREDIRTIKAQYALEQNTFALHENNISVYRNELNRLEELRKEYESNRQEEINDFNLKINEEKVKRDSLSLQKNAIKKIVDCSEKQTILGELNQFSEFINKLGQMKSALMVDINVYSRELKKLENSPEICPTCKRIFTDEHFNAINIEKDSLNKKINDIRQQLDVLEAKIREVEENIKGSNKRLEYFVSHEQNLEFLSREINECERIIKVYQDEIIKKEKKEDISGINNFKTLIETTEKQLKNVQKALDLLETDLNKMSICEHILGEYGIKTYIVNQLLELFNNRIMFYLNALKSTFTFKFNEYFEEEIKDHNNILCLYNNCSGAEMKKIDLAISFAINDILNLQRQISYNVMFFDEILDSSLDDKSLNIVLDFISEHCHKENKAVYIISHKSGAQIPFINEVITLEKVNGFTKRIIN
jgi:DNA repair exonuclease SbcCD ATPase subunit